MTGANPRRSAPVSTVFLAVFMLGPALLSMPAIAQDLSSSYKTVVNETSAKNNAGDTLAYSVVVVESGGSSVTGTQVVDTIPSNTTLVGGSIEVCVDPSPPSSCSALTEGVDYTNDSTGSTIDINSFTVPSNGQVKVSFKVTIDNSVVAGDVISNVANITSSDNPSIDVDAASPDLVVYGPPATGTKAVYLQDINSGGNELLTRTLQASGSGTSITLAEGGSVTLNLDNPLTDDITLTSTTTIPVDLVLARAGTGNFNRDVEVSLGYGPNPSLITTVATQQLTLGVTETISVESFALPVSSTTNIAQGDILQLEITNASNGPAMQSLSAYTENGGNLSVVFLEMDPKINIDSVSFHDDTMANGGGSVVSNPDPGDTFYIRAIVSDPFGDADIEAVDGTPDLVSTPPSGGTGSATITFESPEFDDGDPNTRTFEWEVTLPPEGTGSGQRPRGNWSIQVTTNEGSEETLAGPPPTFISHTVVQGFTTFDDPNLSTSIKEYTNLGDVDPGDTVTYIITLTNTGGIDADNVSFSDTLQSSPLALTFVSAGTTCTDEVGTPLPSPSHASGVVTLGNISVDAGGSCTITINANVGAGSPGDPIDNTATITNPDGPGATPIAATILLSESQIPVADNKQLYLDGIGGSSILTRTQPLSASQTSLASGGGATQLVLASTITRAMELESGGITIRLYLSETGAQTNRTVRVDLEVDPDGASGYQAIDFNEQTIALTGSAERYTLNLNNPSTIQLSPGALFRLTVTNNSGGGNQAVILYQQASSPYSEAVLPLLNAIEVTEISFWDMSGNDSGGCAPTCGSQIDPALVATGNTIWVRATIADGFGSGDVNPGCELGSPTNCPTLTLTDPQAGDQTPAPPGNELAYLTAPDVSSRQFELEISPGTFMDGLEGVWQVDITGHEGTEGFVSDTGAATFERYGPPEILIVKTASGSTSPGSIVTYNVNASNDGTGPATTMTIDSRIATFLGLELIASDGNWTAVYNLNPGTYTVAAEAFDDGSDTFSYDPTGFCGTAIPANSPCYDPAIRQWRVEINEEVPTGDDLDLKYRTGIQ